MPSCRQPYEAKHEDDSAASARPRNNKGVTSHETACHDVIVVVGNMVGVDADDLDSGEFGKGDAEGGSDGDRRLT